MGRRRHKRQLAEATAGVELNIMPFIDIFSLLCTFLLFSAVFISIGIHAVQIPFLTNAAPPPGPPEKSRNISVRVDVTKTQITVESSWSEPPVDKRSEKFPFTTEGLDSLHNTLSSMRNEDKAFDKIDFFTSDDLIYEDLVKLLDAIKLRRATDPVFEGKKGEPDAVFLIPKVVMSSVIL